MKKKGCDILCADSYVGMTDILKKKVEQTRKEKASNRRIYWQEKRKIIKTELTTTRNNNSQSTADLMHAACSDLLKLRKMTETICTSTCWDALLLSPMESRLIVWNY